MTAVVVSLTVVITSLSPQSYNMVQLLSYQRNTVLKCQVVVNIADAVADVMSSKRSVANDDWHKLNSFVGVTMGGIEFPIKSTTKVDCSPQVQN